MYTISAIVLFAVLLVLTAVNASGGRFDKKFIGKQLPPLFIAALSCICAAVIEYRMSHAAKTSEEMTFLDKYEGFLILIMTLCALCNGVLLIRGISIFSRAGRYYSENVSDGHKTVSPSDIRFFALPDKTPDKRSFAQRLKTLIAPTLLFSYMFFIFGILEMYFSNMTEWHFTLWDILIPMLVLSLLPVGAALLAARFVKGAALDIISGTLAVICLLAYVQNGFLNGDTLLNGKNASASGAELIANNLLWIILLSLPVIACLKNKRAAVVKGSLYISLALLFMQAAPLPFMLAEGLPNVGKTKEEFILDGSGQFAVSDRENITVFIMDSYWTGFFEDFLESYPEYYGILGDFTYFDNVSSRHGSTASSMPCILTAADIDFSVSIADAYKNMWQSESAEYFYRALHDNGYEVRLYTDADQYCGSAVNMRGKIDNVIGHLPVYTVDKTRTCLAMLKLPFFRYMPAALKNFFVVYDAADINRFVIDENGFNGDTSDWDAVTLTSNDRGIAFYNFDYYAEMPEKLYTVSDKKLCTFQHLMGVHAPYCSNTKKPGDAAPLESQQSCMEILFRYIDYMKEIGVYEKSTVIVMGDHGMNDTTNQRSPIVLVKRPGEDGGQRLVRNSAPGVLQDDIIPTVLDCAGIQYSPVGRSLFGIDENENRKRTHIMLTNSPDFPFVPKCGSYGLSMYNCAREYEIITKSEDIDLDNDSYTVIPITDYWW